MGPATDGFVAGSQLALGHINLTFLAGYHKGAADVFLQLHGTTGAPADQRVPDHVQKIYAGDNFYLALPQGGMGFDKLYVAVSTTAGTYTAGAADIMFSFLCN